MATGRRQNFHTDAVPCQPCLIKLLHVLFHIMRIRWYSRSWGGLWWGVCQAFGTAPACRPLKVSCKIIATSKKKNKKPSLLIIKHCSLALICAKSRPTLAAIFWVFCPPSQFHAHLWWGLQFYFPEEFKHKSVYCAFPSYFKIIIYALNVKCPSELTAKTKLKIRSSTSYNENTNPF